MMLWMTAERDRQRERERERERQTERERANWNRDDCSMIFFPTKQAKHLAILRRKISAALQNPRVTKYKAHSLPQADNSPQAMCGNKGTPSTVRSQCLVSALRRTAARPDQPADRPSNTCLLRLTKKQNSGRRQRSGHTQAFPQNSERIQRLFFFLLLCKFFCPIRKREWNCAISLTCNFPNLNNK